MSAYLGKCKACGRGVRMVDAAHVGSYLLANGYHGDLFQSGETYGWNHRGGCVPAWALCLCGANIKIALLRGKRNAAIVCNAKCQASHGPTCECSCGGKNHGAAYAT